MRKRFIWKELCLLLLGIIIGYSVHPSPKKVPIITIKKDSVIRDTLYVQLNRENVLKEIKRANIKFPEIILQQAILETGNFTSRACKQDHNLFGLRKGNSYRKYPDWQKSIIAYKELIQNRYIEGENYYSFLTRIGYSELGSEYSSRLKTVI